jgi:hypothetical protein
MRLLLTFHAAIRHFEAVILESVVVSLNPSELLASITAGRLGCLHFRHPKV